MNLKLPTNGLEFAAHLSSSRMAAHSEENAMYSRSSSS